MSTVIYLILAIVTISGILYSVTSSMESAKNNLNIVSNIKKGDEIFSVLKNTVSLNGDMEIVIPMPEKNAEGNPTVPSWVYSDSQNSLGNDFLYCPFLSAGNQPSDLSVVSYRSKDDGYEVSGYADNLMAGRQYAINSSKNMVVNGENVIFAIATLNKKEKDVSCDDIFVNGKKLRIKNGKVWSFTDKLFSQKGDGAGGSAVLFVSSDEQQLLKGNMSGLDKFNPTSISSALSSVMYGRYNNINIRFYDGEYIIPNGFLRTGFDKDGYELSSVSITFESINKTNNFRDELSSRSHGVKIIPEVASSNFELKNTNLVINDVLMDLNIRLSNGRIALNNTEIDALSILNSDEAMIRNSRLGSFNSINSDVTFTDNVSVDGYLLASNSELSVSAKNNDTPNLFRVGGGDHSIGVIIDKGSSLNVKDSFVEISTSESDYMMRAMDSSVSFYGSVVNLRKIGGGSAEGGIISDRDFVFLNSGVTLSEDTNLTYGFNIYSGGRAKIDSSSVFSYGNIPNISIVDNGMSFVSGGMVNVKRSPLSGVCWSGPIFKNSGANLSSPVKPEVDDGYYDYNKMTNRSNWQCN